MIIPDTSQAEKWVTPETFLFKKRLYRITPDCKVIRVVDKKRDSKAAAVKQE